MYDGEVWFNVRMEESGVAFIACVLRPLEWFGRLSFAE